MGRGFDNEDETDNSSEGKTPFMLYLESISQIISYEPERHGQRDSNSDGVRIVVKFIMILFISVLYLGAKICDFVYRKIVEYRREQERRMADEAAAEDSDNQAYNAPDNEVPNYQPQTSGRRRIVTNQQAEPQTYSAPTPANHSNKPHRQLDL